MNIILFAGQGAQYSGMGKDIFESFRSAQAVLKTGSGILGYDLEKVCFDENFTELSRTLYAQPAIMAMELMCFEAAKEKGLVRSEGKDYVIKDGDIVLFRFNV